MKWDTRNSWIACDLVVFVDDLRGSGPTAELTWSVSWVVASQIQYLGIQEASRERRPPTRTPGAWAGGVFRTSGTSVSVTVAQEKWDKGRKIIDTLWSIVELGGADYEGADVSKISLAYKALEIARGFLVHLAITIETLSHHLKGFHLALAAHLPRCNDEGRKLSDSEWSSYLLSKVARGDITETEVEQYGTRYEQSSTYDPTSTVKLTQHLRDNLYAMREFLSTPRPPEVQARRQTVHLLLYGFADASGGGLGSTITVPGTGI
jgi:hypothetical protein